MFVAVCIGAPATQQRAQYAVAASAWKAFVQSVVEEGAIPSEKSQWHRIHAAAHAHGETVTAVVIGANEGGSELNEWAGSIIRKLRWQVHLIEPVPALFDKLVGNYAAHVASGKAHTHQLAVSPDRGAIQFSGDSRDVTASRLVGRCSFHAPSTACIQQRVLCPFNKTFGAQTGRLEQPSRSDGINKAGLFGSKVMSEDKTTTEALTVPCVHTADLWTVLDLQVGEVDILSIDTEGFDYPILTSLLENTAMRPLAIGFESKFFTKKQLAHIRRLLASRGYCTYDANATPDAPHFAEQQSLNVARATGTDPAARAWGTEYIELMAFRRPPAASEDGSEAALLNCSLPAR